MAEASRTSRTAHFRVVGTELPGRTCGPSNDRPDGYRDIHVGIQRGKEVVDLVPGDASEAVFELDVTVKGDRFTGPYVHGGGGQRFLYLSWGELGDDGFRMFRRAKLHIDHIDAAAAEGRTVGGELTLTDAKGGPLCASVRPPRITWTIR